MGSLLENKERNSNSQSLGESESNCMESERNCMGSEHNQIERESNHMEIERNQMESERNQTESERNQIEKDRNQMESERNQTESDGNQMERESNQMESEHKQMESEHKQMESEHNQTESDSPVDSRYSWVILFVAFFLNMVMNSASGGMGVMLVELMHHFNVRRSVIFWIGGIMVSVGFLASFLIGWLIKKFGCRWTGCIASLCASASLIIASFAQSISALFISYGFMLGLSVTFYFNIASIIIQQYFEKRRALAQGTLMSGLSCGLFIWPPFTRHMIDLYGWRGAMLILAGVQLHGIVLCALIRPFPKSHSEEYVYRPICRKSITQLPPGKNSGQSDPNLPPLTKKSVQYDTKDEVMELTTFEDPNEGVTAKMLAANGNGRPSMDMGQGSGCCGGGRGARCFRALFKIILIFPHYLLYMIATVLVQTGNVMPYTLTPARADALGIDKHLGALLVSVCAGISGICRVLCGFIADHPSVNRLVLCGVSGIVAGALTAFSTLLTTFLGLVIIFGLIGIPSAGYMATFGSAAVDIVGKKYVQQAIGLMSVAFGIAQLTTFLVTGWLNDLLGDPKYAFLVFGVAEAIGGIVYLAVYFVDRRVKQNTVQLPLNAIPSNKA